MVAREGYAIIAIAWAVTLLLVVLILWAPDLQGIVEKLLAIGAIVFIGFFSLFFFRDPHRTIPLGADALLLSPADGKIIAIEEVDEPLYLEGPARQISIFLSLMSVHVNRAPAGGAVEFDAYEPGEYLVAWHPKSSEKNERSQLGVRHASGSKVLFKQIAGALARRVVYHISVGDTIEAGERFGVIKFGSRMDVLVPLDVSTEVEIGERVRAGETILGRFSAES